MKILVTGGAGFVARHLSRELTRNGNEAVLTDVVDARLADFHRADLTDRAAITNLIRQVQPEAIVHLGAISFVPDAAKDPGLLERVNVGGTRNLLEALQNAPQRERRNPAFLFVSTAQVNHNPQSAYAKSKFDAETVVLEYAKKGIRVVIARPSNHTGPGQSSKFVVPSFIRQALDIKAGRRAKFSVGNLNSIRDFTDVRDVVTAYRILLTHSEPGNIYYIGSNNLITIGQLLKQIAETVGISPESETDSALWRPTDASEILNISPLVRLGWAPSIPLEQTLRDMATEISKAYPQITRE